MDITNPLDINLDTLLKEESDQIAVKELNKARTKDYLLEQISLMKVAISKIDIFNLRQGPYTNTALSKVQICKESLERNEEKIVEESLVKIQKILARIEKVIAKKTSYGKRIDKYLERKDNNIIESIKSNLLELDLEAFEKIRTKLIGYKTTLEKIAERLENEVKKSKALNPSPIIPEGVDVEPSKTN